MTLMTAETREKHKQDDDKIKAATILHNNL